MSEKRKEKSKEHISKMREILIDKVTVNIGVGGMGEALDNAVELLKKLTGKKPILTKAKKRNPTWGLRKGLPIGAKVTLRGKDAIEFLKKALKAVKNKIKERSFDRLGNFSFGVKSYIDFPGAKYDPNIGMYGFDVCVTLKRRGFRVKQRKIAKARVGKKHLINKEEAKAFLEKNFGVEVVG